MIQSKLCHSKTETQNVNGAKMVGIIKTCNQYPHKFNNGHIFSSLIVSSPHPLSAGGKIDFQNRKGVISFCLESDDKNLVGNFGWRHKQKRIDSIF